MGEMNYAGFAIILLIVMNLGFHCRGYSQETICHRHNKVNPAQEPANGPRCRIIGEVFYFDGAVTEDLFYELRDYAPQIKTIELNSYGGHVVAAYKIAELVRGRGLSTNVRKGAKCASACTLIFQAGAQRTAYPTTRFLYHSARLSSLWVDDWLETRDSIKAGTVDREKHLDQLAQQFVEVREETEKFFAQLILYGLNPDLIRMYKQRSEITTWFEDGNFTRTDNWIISSLQLTQFNVVQDFDYRETVPEN